MIKLIAIAALFALPVAGFSQSNSVADLQKKYKDDNVFTVNLNQALKIVAVSSSARHYSRADIKKLKKQISRESFEELMSVKNRDGEFQLHLMDRKGKPAQLIMIADSESKGFIALDFTEKETE